MSDVQVTVPKDTAGIPINRAMGIPLVSTKLLGSTEYVDIFDLSQYPHRTFTGISIENPSNTLSIYVAIGIKGTVAKCIQIQPSRFVTLDNQSFGAPFFDESMNERCVAVRAALSSTSGTLSKATINYSADIGAPDVLPADQDAISINSIVYEFSADGSVAPGRVHVAIAATADLTWTALKNAINANDPNVIATINTTSHIVTVTANAGGTSGDGIPLVVVTGLATEVVDAATAGSAGGIAAIFHIW